MQGVIIKAISGFYYVNTGDCIYECKARGSFRKAEVSPVVGDRVIISVTGNKGVIEEINERKNLLNRPMVANIDKLFIVSSHSCPAPDTFIIDRLTAVCEYNKIVPVIVFNKCDTGSFAEFERIYKNTPYNVYTVSAKTGEGIQSIREEIGNNICAFAGNSGVGKSSILNAILPNLELKTGEISEKLGRGRHTTRHTELFPCGDGFVVDTPGFSSFEGEKQNYDFKEALPLCFPEFSYYLDLCKFTSCTHMCEKGCAVLKAVMENKIEISRHNSYVKLFNELKDLKEWNLKQKNK